MSKWKTVALSEITESVDYGVTASATQQPTEPKFLRITDIQNGSVNWNNVPWCECDDRSAVDGRLAPGDIVFARTGATTGKSFLVRACPPDTVFASYLIRVRLGAAAEPRFVSHFFQTPDYWAQIAKCARGVAQPGVNATTLRAIQIPLPSLVEQRQIAEILDQAEFLRVKRREALAKLDTLIQSLFLDLFGDPERNPKGWPKRTLAEICGKDGQYGCAVAAAPFNNGKPRYIRITDINEFGSLNDACVAPSGQPSEWDDYILREGDILFARSGATVGKSFLYRAKHGPAVFAGYLIRFQLPTDECLSEFVSHFTRTSAYWRWVAHNQRVVAQPNINAQKYGHDLQIPVPPLALRRDFAAQAAGIEQLKSTQQASFTKLNALFLSLQQRAFCGEL